MPNSPTPKPPPRERKTLPPSRINCHKIFRVQNISAHTSLQENYATDENSEKQEAHRTEVVQILGRRS